MALAERQLAKLIAKSDAKHARRAAVEAAPVGQRRRAGRRPVPVEQNARVRQARARLEKARVAEAAQTEAAERMASITDPQSRIQPLRWRLAAGLQLSGADRRRRADHGQ